MLGSESEGSSFKQLALFFEDLGRVNSINILHAAFAPIFFHQKVTEPKYKYIQKSCAKHFRTKKESLICL